MAKTKYRADDGHGPKLDRTNDMLSSLLEDSGLRASFVGSASTERNRGFAFPGNRAASLHVVIRGEAWVGAKATLRALSTGDVALLPSDMQSFALGKPDATLHELPANVPQVVSVELCDPERQAFRLLTVALEIPSQRSRPLLGALPQALFLRLSPALLDLATRTADLAGRRERGTDFASLRLGEALFSQVVGLALGEVGLPDVWMPALRDERLAPVLRALHAEPANGWTIAKLARTAGLSSAAFCRQFTALTGTSPARYVRELRVERARSLLAVSSMSVAQVAASVGYESESAFSRAYVLSTGQRPGRARGKPRAVLRTTVHESQLAHGAKRRRNP